MTARGEKTLGIRPCNLSARQICSVGGFGIGFLFTTTNGHFSKLGGTHISDGFSFRFVAGVWGKLEPGIG